jgi:hypothetical protein
VSGGIVKEKSTAIVDLIVEELDECLENAPIILNFPSSRLSQVLGPWTMGKMAGLTVDTFGFDQ